MKKRISIICGSVLGVLLIALGFAGNYFYSVSVDRSHGSVELHGGEEAEPVSATVDEEKLAEQEAIAWQEAQDFEILEHVSEDGLKLKAKFLKSEPSSGKAVILAHGYRGHSDQMPGITRFYHEQGFDVLKPDARGHGESEGDYVGYGWHDRKDYQKWIDLLINEKGATNILLHGFSMGGATVLMTSGEDLPDEVKGIINDSGYTSVREELVHQLKHMYGLPSFPLMEVTSFITNLRAGYTFEEASAIEQVKKNTRPLLIIHGDQDDLVPTEMAYRIEEVAKSDKELWIVPGAGHTKGYTVAKEEYEQRVLDFITKVLD
ncbi:alpha/beta hydrolase [Cytobacillus sp. FJAT-54145]|uniref:Alpha/beta hydrolase n=1 Tax=Cytobacillus spartinae TaxID=3299023 RepID=A0ABW6KJ10_9BACI